MRMHKIFLSLGLMMAAVSAQASVPSVLKIGLETGYPPFESKNAAGEIVGFDIDLANAICAKLAVKCEWVEQPFDVLIPGLIARKFHLAHSSMNVTPERLKVVNFTHNLYVTPTRLVAKADSGLVATAASLKGKKVGVLQGSQQETYAKRFWGGHGVTIVSYPDQNQTYLDLAAGRLDALLTDGPQAVPFLETDAGKPFALVGEEIRDASITNDVAMAVRKEDKKLKAAIDKAIVELIKDGTFDKIAKQYFKPAELRISDVGNKLVG